MKILYEFRNGNLYVLTLNEKIKIKDTQIYSVTGSIKYKKNMNPKDIYPEGTNPQNLDYVNFNKHYGYSRIWPEKKYYTESIQEKPLLCLQLVHYKDKDEKEENQKYNIYVDAESFYKAVELDGKSHIIIDSISDYIEWIQIYQTVSMFVTCENVLGKYIEKMYCIFETKRPAELMRLKKLRELAKDSKNYILNEILLASGNNTVKTQKDFISLYNKLKENKIFVDSYVKLEEKYRKIEVNHEDILINSENNTRKRINEDRETLVKVYDKIMTEEVDEDKRIEATATPKPSQRIKGEALCAIEQVIVRYNRGNHAMYYRGVGHIIYPDMPGVFRGDRKYEEDRLYKAMMIAFPKEFSGLRYLDRLAKLQHFELSTRLLDVTSNPLVALYMACNTIYTGDKKQIDWGEVLLYFMAGEKERAYDSKSILINAALVKLPYDEKTVMYQFIYIHKAYMYNQMKGDEKIALRNKYQEILNRCVHLACDYGIEATIPSNEAESIKQLFMEINNTYTREKIKMRFENAKTARDFCWLCMEGVMWPDGDRNWRSVGCSDKFSNYTKKVEKDQYDYLFNEVVNAYNDLLITIRRENPAFQNKINLFELLKSFHGNIGMTNERILAQSGSFIISGLENLYICREMISSRSENYIRIIIKDKEKIFKELSLFNITDATMLPDITHKANHLLEKIKK